MNFTDPWGFLLLESSLVACVLIIVTFIRRSGDAVSPKRAKALSAGRKSLTANLERIDELLRESESFSREFSQALSEKREIVKLLTESLDERIGRLKALLEKMETTPLSSEKGSSGNILEMAQAGCDVAEIARRLGLSKEEVQLNLDLKNLKSC